MKVVDGHQVKTKSSALEGPRLLQLHPLQASARTTFWIVETSTPPWKTDLDSVCVCNSYKLVHYLLGDLSPSLHILTDKLSILKGIQITWRPLDKRSPSIIGRGSSSQKQQLS